MATPPMTPLFSTTKTLLTCEYHGRKTTGELWEGTVYRKKKNDSNKSCKHMENAAGRRRRGIKPEIDGVVQLTNEGVREGFRRLNRRRVRGGIVLQVSCERELLSHHNNETKT